MKYMGKIKDTVTFKSYRSLKNNTPNLGLMVLFDALFIVSFIVLQRLFVYFAQTLFLPTNAIGMFFFVAFTIIYYLALLFAYSFFKYGVLDFIKTLNSKAKFTFGRLGQFYLLNIIIGGILLLIVLVFSQILSSVKPQYATYLFILAAIPFFVFAYIFVNKSHSMFYFGATIKDSILSSHKNILSKLNEFKETITLLMIFGFIMVLVFFIAGYLLRVITSGNNLLYLTSYAYFKQITVLLADVAFYSIILINRVSFYNITNRG